MIKTLVLLALCLTGTCDAATWFVRPGVFTTQDGSGNPIPTPGIYGAQNGTNYDNAWNGIRSVVWGGTGVGPGDTLYVCGTHIYNKPSQYIPSLGTTIITVSGVTIRGDWPGDPGTVFGGRINQRASPGPFTGPDTNGVYNQVLIPGATVAPPKFRVNGTTVTRLKKRTTTTWTDKLGGQYLHGTTNYIQFPDGTPPNTNLVACATGGWGFDLNNKSNLSFQGLTFIAADPVGNGIAALRHAIPQAPFTNAAKSITFDKCSFFDSDPFYLYPGEDNFSFLNCEFGRCASAIYSLLNGKTNPPNSLTVSNCYIHDCGTPEYNDGDGHAVGIQGGNFHLITYNTTFNTGPSIVLWTGAVDMKSNTVSYNFIVNTHTNTSAGISDGISISGDNQGALLGRRVGNRIFGNIVRNCAIGNGYGYQGLGISCNSPDYTEIFNNTIYGGNIGINIEVVHVGYSVNAKVVNNIIVNPKTKYYYMVGNVAPTNLLVDYNLYYPMPTLVGSNSTIFPTVPNNARSIFADPLFISPAPATAWDFQVQPDSKSIGAGIAAGYLYDFNRTRIPTDRPPDLGVYRFISPQVPDPPLNLQIQRIP